MTDRVEAVILAVGSEMLTPTRVDTNSLFISGVLNEVGIPLACKAVVGDSRDELIAQVAHALGRHRVLICTGGLGPTDDDLTREAVAAHLGLPLDEDAVVLETIRARFAARGMAMPEVNRKQAQVPRGARVLENPRGSAPGLLVEHGDRLIALLPGPPREMRPMMDGPVRERLQRLAGGRRLLRRALRVAGRSESRVEEAIQPIYREWLRQSPPIDTTILASPGFIELHLAAVVVDADAGERAMDAAAQALVDRLGADVVSRDGQSIEAVVGALLRERGWRVALAESCTGGLVASRLTDIAGSSDYVDRGVVAYSNDAKTEWLGVPSALIAEHGAVSEPVARAMAEGILARSSSHIAVGITGIAGPGGGSADKPVGTVWLSVAQKEPSLTRAVHCRFPGGREQIKAFAAVTAIDLVRRQLIGAPWDLDWVRR